MIDFGTFCIVVIVTLTVQVALDASRDGWDTIMVVAAHAGIAIGAIVNATINRQEALTAFVLFMYLCPNIMIALLAAVRKWRRRQHQNERMCKWQRAEDRVKALEIRMERRRMPISNTTR